MLAGVPSGFAGREVLGVSVTGRRCIGPSGAVSNQAGAEILSTPLRLVPAHPAMAFAFGPALGDDALWPRAAGVADGTNQNVTFGL